MYWSLISITDAKISGIPRERDPKSLKIMADRWPTVLAA